MIVPVILAGGSGTRLWPLSRELHPKQLIAIFNDQTMIQNTLMRLDGIRGLGSPALICNEAHRFMIAEQLRQIGVEDASILLEPVGRNTAPAIGLAAVSLADQDPILLVLPADHVIQDTAAFHQAIEAGRDLADQGYLITFGIVPDSPQTGYGYIRMGQPLADRGQACRIDRFVEKPNQATAQAYVDTGEYCWNSGMFMFRASAVLKELDALVPRMAEGCRAAVFAGSKDLDFYRVDKTAFSNIASESFDYAVMEKTDKGVMIPLDAGWNDLGSFDALWQAKAKDGGANVLKGDVMIHNVKDSYIHSETRLVTAVGLEGFVIVETSDAVLVAPRDQVQDVKKIVNKLKATGKRQEPVAHKKVFRPWGNYESIDESDRYQVKRITVKPGAKLSLQKHFHRAEHWTVVSGTALVTKGEEEILLKEDESVYIPLGYLHRLENPGKIALELIEVQSGAYLGEDDIVRYEDAYGRKKDPGLKS